MDDKIDFDKLDTILGKMYEDNSAGDPWYIVEGFSEVFETEFKDIQDPLILRYLTKMEELELIDYYSLNPKSSYTKKITKKGIEVIKAGGWKK